MSATACGSDGATAPTTTATHRTTTSSTAPERPTSTTTTTYAPDSVEGQVEAAYLRSWDVYADAVYNLKLDESDLAEVYAETSLRNKRAEIEDRISAGRAAAVRVDHHYDVVVVGPSEANVIDRLINHQVLIDPLSKVPSEPDPNEQLLFNFELRRLAGTWRVTSIHRFDP